MLQEKIIALAIDSHRPKDNTSSRASHVNKSTNFFQELLDGQGPFSLRGFE
jgi:hypothetical protein